MSTLIEPNPTAQLTIPSALEVVTWENPQPDQFDVRTTYVERYWLALLGPSTLWLLRRIARGLEQCPQGFRLHIAETSAALGLGNGQSKNASIHRTIERATQFGMIYRISTERIAAKTQLPRLNQRQLSRLPDALQRSHVGWFAQHGHELGDIAGEK